MKGKHGTFTEIAGGKAASTLSYNGRGKGKINYSREKTGCVVVE